MKKRKKLALVIALATVMLLSLCLLFACGGEDEPTDDGIHRVYLWVSDGVTVRGDSLKTVEDGGSVSFDVEIAEGYVFKSTSHGVYDSESGVLTLDRVGNDVGICFFAEASDLDTSLFFTYVFDGAEGDYSSERSGASLRNGSYISVSANDKSRIFIGWSIGARVSQGGAVISYQRQLDFQITPAYVKGGMLRIYANYTDADKLVYDPNGGSIDTSSVNVRGGSYYTTRVTAGRLEVSLSEDYLDVMEVASSFFDDGSFYRPGYVLYEYNTKPDGSGESYSIGSKVPLNSDEGYKTLYCMWAKASEGFTWRRVTYSRPVSADKAPHWVERGIIITGYEGDDTTVVIPDTIDGYTVTAIAEGAIAGKRVQTLIMGRSIIAVEDGAVTNCPNLTEIYYPDGIYYIGNGALDLVSYSSLDHIYVNATLAPRFTDGGDGGYSVKLSRLLGAKDQKRIIILGGSSAYQGLGSEYLEALLGGEYRVVNFGTTRTTNGIVYLEAMSALAQEGDMILYAPENSTYMFGERELYWKTLRDLEGMNNFYRYIDPSEYTNFFGAFSDFNINYRYERKPVSYEAVCDFEYINSYGDYQHPMRTGLIPGYVDSYYITLNERVKSKQEGEWNNTANQNANKDYTDPTNPTWASITDPYYADSLNRAILSARTSGALVYFAFAPVDGDKLVEGADTQQWLRSYEQLILDTYLFDGIMGECASYVFAHEYFYDCAFHLNDYGRTLRTWRLYLDLADTLGFTDTLGITSVGTAYEGCLFEGDPSGEPLYPWEPRGD